MQTRALQWHMTQWHHVFGRSATGLPHQELADYLTDSWYGDGTPCITQVRADATGYELAVELQTGRIDLVLDSAPAVVADLVGEFLDEHSERIPPDLTGVPRSCHQVVSIGLRPDRRNEAGWELLDQVQAFVAGRLNGLLAIAGDGIYDHDLQLEVGLAGVTPR